MGKKKKQKKQEENYLDRIPQIKKEIAGYAEMNV